MTSDLTNYTYDKETHRELACGMANQMKGGILMMIWGTALLAAVLLVTGCSAPAQVNNPIETSVNDMNKQLIAAAERGDTATLRTLVEDGVNLNTQDMQGRTAIMAAVYENKVDAVRVLIEAGADINKQDNRLNNPFLYSGAEGQLDILKLLIEAKADTKMTNRYGGNALIPAAEKGHVDNVRTLLETTDVNVNHVNNLGWTALLEAIILTDGGTKHQQIVRLLIDHGADVNIADNDGVTPLQHAQRQGYTEIERMLTDAGGR